jgi:hypothetical protein
MTIFRTKARVNVKHTQTAKHTLTVIRASTSVSLDAFFPKAFSAESEKIVAAELLCKIFYFVSHHNSYESYKLQMLE